MSGTLVIERPSGGRPDAARQGATKWFTANGYETASASAQATHLLSTAAHDRHRLVISADAQRVIFDFGPFPAGVTPDPAEFERRVDAAMRAPGVPPAPPARCSVCATLAPAGAETCELCGMALKA